MISTRQNSALAWLTISPGYYELINLDPAHSEPNPCFPLCGQTNMVKTVRAGSYGLTILGRDSGTINHYHRRSQFSWLPYPASLEANRIRHLPVRGSVRPHGAVEVYLSFQSENVREHRIIGVIVALYEKTRPAL